jgi:hypothetical protein
MADKHHQGEMMPLHNGRRSHEMSDVSIKGIAVFGFALLFTGVAITFLLGMVMQIFRRQEIRDRASRPSLFSTAVEIPGPRLQDDPAAERLRWQEEQLKRLNAYGWVDHNAGVAHIPINRAIEILARTGLPEIEAPPTTDSAPTAQPSAERSDRPKSKQPSEPEKNP